MENNNAFVRAALNYKLTENGGNAYSTTSSAVLDLFASIGANLTSEEFIKRLEASFDEDKDLTLRLIFFLRDITAGLGRRELFRNAISWLSEKDPILVQKNIRLIPYYGRWDDMYSLVGTKCENIMWEVLISQFKQDWENLINDDVCKISLLPKWLKSINAESQKSRELGRKTARMLSLSFTEYRKKLSKLRSAIDVVERKICGKDWSNINYETVPSQASLLYNNIFMKYDNERYSDYLKGVEAGKNKINTNTIYPYQIIDKMELEVKSFLTKKSQVNPTADEDVIKNNEILWNNLPNYIGNNSKNVLVMCDTSLSMFTCLKKVKPISVAISLAIYFAERNKGPFKNTFMTFSSLPEFVELKGSSLSEKISNIQIINSNTDLDLGFKKILDLAVNNNIPSDDMPKTLLIVSDMEIDNFRSENEYDIISKYHKEFESHGYKLPEIIFWNVSGKSSTFLTTDRTGIKFVSGLSPTMFKNIMECVGDDSNGYDFMIKTLNSPRYDLISDTKDYMFAYTKKWASITSSEFYETKNGWKIFHRTGEKKFIIIDIHNNDYQNSITLNLFKVSVDYHDYYDVKNIICYSTDYEVISQMAGRNVKNFVAEECCHDIFKSDEDFERIPYFMERYLRLGFEV